MKISFGIVFLLIVIMSFKLKTDNVLLYKQSLISHVSTVNADTIYILKCSDIELPSKIGKYTIVDISENTSLFLNNKLSLYAIKLTPVEISRGTIEIILVDYIIQNNAGEVMMSNTGSVIYSYKYESKSNRYTLVKKVKYTI